jgi:hypothetical protein
MPRGKRGNHASANQQHRWRDLPQVASTGYVKLRVERKGAACAHGGQRPRLHADHSRQARQYITVMDEAPRPVRNVYGFEMSAQDVELDGRSGEAMKRQPDMGVVKGGHEPLNDALRKWKGQRPVLGASKIVLTRFHVVDVEAFLGATTIQAN